MSGGTWRHTLFSVKTQVAAPGGMGGGTLLCVKTEVAAPGGMGGGILRHLVLCKNTSGGTSPRLGLYNIKYNEVQVRACGSWGRAGKPSI